jgi:hypothetical protein
MCIRLLGLVWGVTTPRLYNCNQPLDYIIVILVLESIKHLIYPM